MKVALLFSFLVFALAFTLAPPIDYRRGAVRGAIAVNNAKQVSIALLEFEGTYGHFPGEDVPEELQTGYPSQNRSDSNYILGQLIAAKIYDTEEYFTITGAKRPDGVISPSNEILRAGECQFSFISGTESSPINYRDFPADTPILLAPMIGNSNLFDPTFYNSKGLAICAHLDSSVKRIPVDRSGVAFMSKSKKINLLDPSNRIWKGQAPKIHHPLPYKGAPSGNTLNQPRPWTRTQVINTTDLGLIVFAIAFYLFQRFKKNSFRNGSR